MDEILQLRIGETKEIAVTYKRVVNLGNYSSKTYSHSTVVSVDKYISGIERDVLSAILSAQLEFACLSQMYVNNEMSKEEFDNEKNRLSGYIKSMLKKAEGMGIETKWILEDKK